MFGFLMRLSVLKTQSKTIVCMRRRRGVMGDHGSNEYYHRGIYD